MSISSPKEGNPIELVEAKWHALGLQLVQETDPAPDVRPQYV